MKLQKSSVARRVVETKNLGVAEGRRWEEREVIVGGVACERGRGGELGSGAGGKKESSADSAADEEGLRCSLVAFSPLLLCYYCCHQEGVLASANFGKVLCYHLNI